MLEITNPRRTRCYLHDRDDLEEEIIVLSPSGRDCLQNANEDAAWTVSDFQVLREVTS